MTKASPTNTLSSLAGADTNSLRLLKPPVEIPSGWAWLWWTLGTLALAALLFWAWKYWQKKKKSAPPVPVIPPHVRAKQRLREALTFIHDPRQFCILVSDTVRWYLEEQFNFRAPERTTEEFLHELQNSPVLTGDQKANLGDFLERCDLVKFARYEPREPELHDLHDSALRLVEETQAAPPTAVSDMPPPPPPNPIAPASAAAANEPSPPVQP